MSTEDFFKACKPPLQSNLPDNDRISAYHQRVQLFVANGFFIHFRHCTLLLFFCNYSEPTIIHLAKASRSHCAYVVSELVLSIMACSSIFIKCFIMHYEWWIAIMIESLNELNTSNQTEFIKLYCLNQIEINILLYTSVSISVECRITIIFCLFLSCLVSTCNMLY